MNREKIVVLWTGILSVIVGLFITQHIVMLNHDVAVHYTFADYLINGAKPYDDFVDMNFPMIWYISAIPAFVSKLLPTEKPLVLYVYFTGIIASLLYYCWKNLSDKYRSSYEEYIPVIIILTFSVLFVFPFLSNYGQREQLICFLLLPYMLNIRRRIENRSEGNNGIYVGICLGIAIALKPHYCLVVVGVEMYRLFLSTSVNKPFFTKETISALCFLALYIVSTFLLFPEFSEVLQLAAMNYSRLNIAETASIAKWQWLIMPTALIFAARYYKLRLYISEILLIAAWICALIGIIQRQGYDYHIIPAESFGKASLLIGLYFFSGKYFSEHIKNKIVPLVFSASLILIVCFYISVPVRLAQKGHLLSSELIPSTCTIIEKYAHKGTVYNLTTEVPPTYPSVLYTTASPVGNYTCLWFIHNFYKDTPKKQYAVFPYHTLRTMGETEKKMFYSVIKSLQKEKPDLIMVSQKNKQFYFEGKQGFDCIAYFNQDLSFKQFFSNYRLVDSTQSKYFYKNMQ